MSERSAAIDLTLFRDWVRVDVRYSDLDTIVGTACDWHRSHPDGYR